MDLAGEVWTKRGDWKEGKVRRVEGGEGEVVARSRDFYPQD